MNDLPQYITRKQGCCYFIHLTKPIRTKDGKTICVRYNLYKDNGKTITYKADKRTTKDVEFI